MMMNNDERNTTKVNIDETSTLTWNQVKDILPKIGKDLYTDLAKRARIAGLQSDVIEEVHWSSNGAKAGVNSLIDHYIKVYSLNDSKSEKLSERFSNLYLERIDRGKKKFIKNLIDNNINFNYIYSSGEVNEVISEIIDKQGSNYKNDWTNKDLGRLILAKHNGEEISLNNYLSLLSDKNIRTLSFNVELNPLLEQYFTHNIFIANNFNTAIVGPAYGHPAKKLVIDSIDESNLINADELGESLRQLAQFKRMVILPATLHTYLQRTITGIPTRYKLSVINDIKASTFNFTGLSGGVDSHDGGAFSNPFIAYLENLSLQDSAVGIDKKPIGHFYNAEYGSAGLLKFALFILNNERIRNTGGSAISLKNMLRKMTDLTWDIPTLDLTLNYNEKKQTLSELLKDRVFFKSGNRFIEVLSMDSIGNNTYNFTKVEVDRQGNSIGEQYVTRNYINTNYKLWETLGGEESLSLQNGNLEYSDASIEHVVKFINAVGIQRTPDNAKKYNNDLGQKEYGKLVSYRDIDNTTASQNTIYQPMKHSMIAYLVNKSAIKNGAANVNNSSAFYDTNNLDYMEIDTQNIGIQLDADHEADESELTEMSQVISALEENGYTHAISKDTYISLAKVVEKTNKPLITALASYYTKGDKSEITEIITKALIKVHSNMKRNSVGLAKSIMDKIEEEFKNTNRERKYEMPFSDPNIMSSAISTITSNVNKTSIRRKYSGIASILVPSYNIIQTFDYGQGFTKYENLPENLPFLTNEQLALVPELIIESANDTFNTYGEGIQFNDGSISKPIEQGKFANINEYIAYLQQKSQKYAELAEERINFNSDADFENYINEQITIDNKLKPLRDLTESQPFLRRNQLELEDTYEIYNENGEFVGLETLDTYKKYEDIKANLNYTFKKAYYVPQNLKPSRVSFEIGNGVYSVFDLDTIKNTFNGDKSLQAKQAVQRTFEQIKQGLIDVPQILIEDIRNGMIDINSGLEFVRNQEIIDTSSLLEEIAGLNGIPNLEGLKIKINNVKIKEAELILPKIYQTQFGLRQGDNINNIKEQKENFFYERMKEGMKVRSSNYDMVFKRGNGNHMYILFEGNLLNNSLKPIEIETIVQDDKTYRVNDFGEILYNTEGITTMVDNTGSEILLVKDSLKAMEMYQSESFDSVDFNINTKSLNSIAEFLNNSNADRTLINLRDRLNNSTERVNGNIEQGFQNMMKGKEIWTLEILRESSKRKYSSFIKSLQFVAARIPSQAMQSFMPMQVVEFTDSDKNIAYVSHFQMWLQGSDFDIDKVFLMGSEFDKNGTYMGWSPLFDYSTPERLAKSELLPIPNGVEYEIRPQQEGIEGIDITDHIISLYLGGFPGNEKGFRVNVVPMAELLNHINTEDYNFTKSGKAILTFNEAKVFDYIRPDLLKQSMINLTGTINTHTLYDPEDSIAVQQFKNSVSSKIYRIINDLSNFVAAYSPVDMDAPQAAAETSQSGRESRTLSLDSPSTNYIMQFQNMAGKEVIGIAAVGEKVFFALSYYFNEGMSKPEWFNNMFFNKRFLFNGETIVKNVIANVNFKEYANAMIYWQNAISRELQRGSDITEERYNELLQEAISTQIQGNQEDASLIISALLSAATDNAKELILSKINAGSDFASIYIYAIMLGIDFQTIADFMKSHTVQVTSKLTKGNIFDDSQITLSLDEVFKYYTAEKFVLPVNKFSIDSIISNRNFIDDIVNNSPSDGKAYISTIVKRIVDLNGGFDEKTRIDAFNTQLISEFIEDSSEEHNKYFLNAIEALPSKYGVNNKIKFARIFETVNYLNGLGVDVPSIFMLKNLKDLSSELADLGKIFKINQGMPTTISGLYTYQQNIEQVVFTASKGYITFDEKDKTKFDPKATAEKVLRDKPYLIEMLKLPKGIELVHLGSLIEKYYLKGIATNFSFDRFLTEPDYKKDSIDYYNLVKGTFNVLDIIDKVPHFKSMINAFKTSYSMMDVVSSRYRELKKITRTYSRDRAFNGGNNVYPIKLDERTINEISDFLNEAIISKWLRSLDRTILIEPGNRIFDRKGNLSAPLLSNYELNLGTDYGQATFKYWFENVVFPNLRKGIVDQGLKSIVSDNRFIQGLKMTTKDDATTLNLINYLKLDLNMTNITTDFDKTRYQTFLVDFKQLDKVTVNGLAVSELMFLYNIIVNKNKYGPNNLTKLFEDYILSSESTIINDYLQFVGNLDSRDLFIQDQDFTYPDILFRIAPTLKRNELNYKFYQYAKTYNRETKSFDFYVNNSDFGKPKYDKMEITPEMSNYFRTMMPNFSNIFQRNVSNLNKSEFTDSIQRLLNTNQLQILLDCE